MLANPLSERLVAFVRDIGIAVNPATLDGPTFLPGLDIRYGVLLVDEERLTYPGDILHEAGHIAVSSPEERKLEKIDPTPGDEMTAIAWSWAALRHLDIPPEVVFHPAGYKGGSQSIIENFSAGHYFGVPLLQLYEMTVESRVASERGVEPFPHMLRWLR
jgi:hypothetical protein